MKARRVGFLPRLYAFVYLCINYGLDPISAGAYVMGALGISAGFAGYKFIRCKYEECCDSQWIDLKSSDLEQDFTHNLFGQHLVKANVPKALLRHVLNAQPKKALVMSFHGWTGSGKNHVSQMIAKHLFKKGAESQFHHLYIGTRDFPHEEEVNKYRAQLRKEIEEATQKCDRSLFIFDEVDKIPPGVLDTLKPYIDYHKNLHGVVYRKNIFIFLSNTGGNNITRVALKFWSDGKNREDIALKDVEHIITGGSYNEPGGLRHSEIVRSALIDHYIPFLPLEKKHVKMCAASELRRRGLKTDSATVNRIADQLLYEPADLYSKFGCKKIAHKVDLFGYEEF
ncbi:Torsin-1B [Araneus ventricosus]|uniref:Torsin-1B n=1 Tax=Araneus ventricosus TaxID=182803 RepID=A0A4Y2PPD9_ARAVE|nr:Torsin-1B [Araneus ventricosus]GBN91683.1 Torsin-1B [Araneus ventricosus]